MRIVITGASGNVGTATLLALGAEGRHQLVGVTRRTPPRVPPYSWAEWAPIDITDLDAAQRLQQAFAGADAVIHLAWLIQPSHDHEALRRTNQDGTAAVVDAAIAAGVPHLVHQSSIGTYAPGHGRTVDESWPATGIATSSYSVDKAAAERIVDRAEEPLTLTRVRPALIFQDAAASEVARYFLGPLVPNRRRTPRSVALRPVPRRSRLPARTRRRCRRRLANDRRTTSLRGVQRRCRPADRPCRLPRDLRRRRSRTPAEATAGRSCGDLARPPAAHRTGLARHGRQRPRLDTTRLRSLGWSPTRRFARGPRPLRRRHLP